MNDANGAQKNIIGINSMPFGFVNPITIPFGKILLVLTNVVLLGIFRNIKRVFENND